MKFYRALFPAGARQINTARNLKILKFQFGGDYRGCLE